MDKNIKGLKAENTILKKIRFPQMMKMILWRFLRRSKV